MMPKPNYLSLLAVVLLVAVASTALVNAQTKASEGEVKAAAAVTSAADATARLTAAEAFVKKYPKSSLRPEVAQGVATEIGKVADAGQRLSLAERYLKTFADDAPAERMRGMVIDEYVRADRADDAFVFGSTILAKQPENVGVLATLAMVGTEAAKKQNTKHVAQTLQYGMKAIALIEADKKPATTDDAAWAYQKSLLPTLYLNMGALSLAGGNAAEARPRLEKAIQLNPAEPAGYLFLGGLIDDEYRAAAESYKAMAEGPEKTAALKKATDLMDKVIDLYAQALGAAADKPQYKAMYDTVLELITPYYRYRYKSTTGLQPLIDKYKTPAKP